MPTCSVTRTTQITPIADLPPAHTERSTMPDQQQIPTADNLTIPWPHVRPLGIAVTAAGVKAAWDTFIRPLQENGGPQSIEERILMATIRAVYDGMNGVTRGPNGEQVQA